MYKLFLPTCCIKTMQVRETAFKWQMKRTMKKVLLIVEYQSFPSKTRKWSFSVSEGDWQSHDQTYQKVSKARREFRREQFHQSGELGDSLDEKMVLPSMPIIIIIIIITRQKPAYGRQGLANILLRASGAQLRSDEVIDKHTLYHNIWVNCYCWGNSSMVEGRFSKWF